MPLVRRLVALSLTTAVIATACVVANPLAVAQDPPNQGAGKDKGKDKNKAGGNAKDKAGGNAKDKAGANQKKPARRKPAGNGAVGSIVPYPIGPVLIIRHTAETHDEIQAFLNMLRYE